MGDAFMINTFSGSYEIRNERYIMDPTNDMVNWRKGGRNNQYTILTYADNSEWVLLTNKREERFCGFLYLQNEIKELNLNIMEAAENKIGIFNNKIIYLSRYYGDKKLDMNEISEHYLGELSILQKDIGFIDMLGYANLRKQDNKLYVFDTEKPSFAKEVHQKIDSFVQQHNLIRSALEESLKD